MSLKRNIGSAVQPRKGEALKLVPTLKDRPTGRRKFYHPYLKVILLEPTGKRTISAKALHAAIEEVVSARK